MAGRPKRREMAQFKASLDMMYVQEREEVRAKIAKWLPDLADGMYDLARGVRIQKEDAEGMPHVYVRAPNFRALAYLMDRMLGSPKVEAEPSAIRLDNARASFIELQIMHDLVAAQKRELEARAGKAEVELEYWPKQFVTEEEEAARISTLCAEFNKFLIEMTPEKFNELTGGKDPAIALEDLKEYMGRSQAEIIQTVLAIEDDGEEGDEEDEE